MAISPQRPTIYLYSAHRAVIFAIAQLSCYTRIYCCCGSLYASLHVVVTNYRENIFLARLVNCGCSDDGGKVQLNNQRDAAGRHGSVSSYYRPASSQHGSFSYHPTSRRASLASRCSAAGDVTGSRDSRKTSIEPGGGPSRQNSVSAVCAAVNMRAQTSVGSASLDEYQHNDLVGDGDQRQKNKVRATIKDVDETTADDSACVADIVRTDWQLQIITIRLRYDFDTTEASSYTCFYDSHMISSCHDDKECTTDCDVFTTESFQTRMILFYLSCGHGLKSNCLFPTLYCRYVTLSSVKLLLVIFLCCSLRFV